MLAYESVARVWSLGFGFLSLNGSPPCRDCERRRRGNECRAKWGERGKVLWRPRPRGLDAAFATFLQTTIFLQSALNQFPFLTPSILYLLLYDRKCALVHYTYFSQGLVLVSPHG